MFGTIVKTVDGFKVLYDFNAQIAIYRLVGSHFVLEESISNNSTNYEHKWGDGVMYKVIVSIPEEMSSCNDVHYVYNDLDLIFNIAKDFKTYVCCLGPDCLECNDHESYTQMHSLLSKLLFLETRILRTLSPKLLDTYTEFIFTASISEFNVEYNLREIIRDEYIRGSSKNQELLKSVVILKYLGIYFTLSEDPLNDLGITTKYNETFLIDSIKDCINRTCTNFKYLYDKYLEIKNNACEEIPQPDDPVIPPSLYIQVIFAELPIGSVANYEYLSTSWDNDFVAEKTLNHTIFTGAELRAGIYIDFQIVGIKSFIIDTPKPTGIKIFDILGNNITDVTFVRYFNVIAEQEIFISKNNFTPASMYFKFK